MTFPKIEHIDDVWPHVKDKSEFIRIDREHYTAIDYVIQTPDSFKTDIQRECRGIKFYPDGRIMARPFHKFFNLGEKRPANEVDLSAPHLPDVLDELEAYEADLMVWYDNIVVHIQEGVTAYACFDTRKNWAVNYVQRRIDPWLQGAMYSAADGLDPKLAAVKAILKNLDRVPCKWRGE